MTKHINFFDNGDKTYDVQIMKSNTDWDTYGTLKYDEDQEAWVLWPEQIDDGVTYEDSLDDTKQEIVDELSDDDE